MIRIQVVDFNTGEDRTETLYSGWEGVLRQRASEKGTSPVVLVFDWLDDRCAQVKRLREGIGKERGSA